MTNISSQVLQQVHLAQSMAGIVGLSEIALALVRRSGAGARSADRGSLLLIWVVMSVSLIAALNASAFVRAWESGLLLQLTTLGIVLYAFGLILRWYSIFHLGRYFTVNVAIAADQRVVDTGPYRLIRHPSYSGALLAWLGIGICTGNWLGLLLMMAPLTAVFLWRIHVEEDALTAGLGEAYANYKARTRRLIPFVY